jgi:D-glycerate 3-kinase
MAGNSLNLDGFLARHRLPESFLSVVDEYYVPLAEWLLARVRGSDFGTFVLGISGAQGTGKTTLANFLNEHLSSNHALSIAQLSIDDIYLTRAERTELASSVHPLLATRGVPGTHDIVLGKSVIHRLFALGDGETMSLPRFDKSVDDRQAVDTWSVVSGPVDLIILEGWCVGSTPLSDEELEEPVNDLEAEEDPNGAWRRYVNERLETDYSELFSVLDALVYLAAPSFEAVFRWRLEQECKLAATADSNASHVMDEAGVARFIQHYERITRHNMDSLPSHSDVVLELGEDQAVTRRI